MKPADERLDSELQYHIDALIAEKIASGLTPEEARRQALIDFGGPGQVKEALRDVHRIALLDAANRNTRDAFRFLRKSPSFSVIAIVTLALGIGASSAVFSTLDAVLLRPLPFPEGDRLMRLSQVASKTPRADTPVAPVRLEDWNRLNATFQAMTGYYTENITETSGALPEKLTQAWVAPRFLQVWGIAPALGRDFNAQEEHFGGPTAVLVSDRLWRGRFGGDPGLVGRSLHTSNGEMTVAGIMPASFLFGDRNVDLWSPVPVDSPYSQSRESTWYTVIGRLKPEMTPGQAQADLATIQARLAKEFPKTDADLQVRIQSLKEATVGGVRRSLWLLFGSVSVLLMIACTNMAGLLLVRTAQRQQEIAVRFSLGASRRAVAVQLLSEMLLLSLLGALAGLWVAEGVLAAFHALARDLPRLEEVHLDLRVVLYALGCALATTLACGLLPALRGTRRSLSGSLTSMGRTVSRSRLQWALVGAQVAMAVTLLAGAGLLVRSFRELGRVSAGFDPARVLTFHVSASWGETADMKRLTERIERTLTVLQAMPGTESVATASVLPGTGGAYPMELQIDERSGDPERRIVAETRFVSPGYFSALKIPLLAGEPCREDPGSVNLMVNKSFANTYLPASSVLGHRLSIKGGSHAPPGDIRGVVGDAREESLSREAGPTVYWCLSAPTPDPFYLVRTHGTPMAMAETIRKKLADIEPGRSVSGLMPLEARLGEAFSENRLRTILLGSFALTALVLACLGLYGTLSYAVSLRYREVALRLALGALPREIASRFLLQGLGVSALGCLAGGILVVPFSRALSGMLYGVTPTDSATFVDVASLMMLVAGAASLLPAFRAARVEPMQVLRQE